MKLKELKETINNTKDQLYFVKVQGNFYGGKFYEVGIDSILVAATSEQEAVTIAKENISAVETHFRNKRYTSRKLAIAKKDPHRFTTDDIGSAKVTTGGRHNKVLKRDGTIGPVNLEK